MPSAPAPTASIYAAFWLYRLDPLWRRLPADQQRRQRTELLEALERRDAATVLRGAYSLVGLRHDTDLLLWVHGPNLDAIQQLAVDVRHTTLGGYLMNAYTYLGVAGGGRYDPQHRPAFLKDAPPRNYLSMYPFVKTHDWYLLPYEQRRALMAEHGQRGRRYTEPRPTDAPPPAPPSGKRAAETAVAVAEPDASPYAGAILTNTVDGYGLGDPEFVVAFESDDPAALCRMIEDLRSVEVRRYTQIDTPVFLGRRRALADVLADL